MKSLSILLPTYNSVCLQLVETLHSQCEAMEGLRYEIIVADDGSTDRSTVSANEAIGRLSHCRLICREQNTGRAAIRNFLAREARYDWLLFMDSDRKPGSKDFVRTYVEGHWEAVVCGGLRVEGDAELLKGNLRYRAEKRYERHNSPQERRQRPYDNFNTSNFMTRREILLQHPFDERFRRYGYEDVMWGKTLRDHHIGIAHTDNPIVIDDYESNPDFVAKTEEGMHTLARFADELEDFSGVVRTWRRVRRMHLAKMLGWWHRLLAPRMKRQLTGNNPRLFVFNMYKLTLFCTIKQES